MLSLLTTGFLQKIIPNALNISTASCRQMLKHKARKKPKRTHLTLITIMGKMPNKMKRKEKARKSAAAHDAIGTITGVMAETTIATTAKKPIAKKITVM
mgnify:CR=1 FL=1